MAYSITLSNDDMIYIDAVTGENLGGAETKGETAGCYAYSGFNSTSFAYATASRNLAASAYKSLGYSNIVNMESLTTTLGNAIRNHLKYSSAYAMYVDAHGSSSVIGVPYVWIVNASEVTGNWHFVFLDCCETAKNTTWAKAFKIYGHSNRAYLGWKTKVTISSAYNFCKYFWPEVVNRHHSKYVESAARWAAAQVPGSGTTPIRFYGDNYYNGHEY